MSRTPELELAFTATIEVAPRINAGQTPLGHRVSFPIIGGTFEGPNISGKVLAGGEDWALIIPGKGYKVSAEYKLQADDGTVIHIKNVGNFFATGGEPVPFGFTTPSFEAPIGDHDWLNDGAYVGTLEAGSPDAEVSAVKIGVFKAR